MKPRDLVADGVNTISEAQTFRSRRAPHVLANLMAVVVGAAVLAQWPNAFATLAVGFAILAFLAISVRFYRCRRLVFGEDGLLYTGPAGGSVRASWDEILSVTGNDRDPDSYLLIQTRRGDVPLENLRDLGRIVDELRRRRPDLRIAIRLGRRRA